MFLFFCVIIDDWSNDYWKFGFASQEKQIISQIYI